MKRYSFGNRQGGNNPPLNRTIMEVINVTISWSGKNYCACTKGDEVNGVIAVTNKSLDGLKKDFSESLKFHIEGCIQDNDILPDWVVSGNYMLNFILDASALIHSLDGIIVRSAIARVTGINEKLIGHYASGNRNPRQKQREKIVNGIHVINRELASIV